MTEDETRRQLIDTRLRLAGWNVDDPAQVTQELDIDLKAASVQVPELRVAESRGPYHGHQFADYGLLLHGQPVAVVEAKRTSKDARLGQEQARQYAQHIQRIHGGPLPLVLYTNGHDIYYWEVDFYPPVRVHGFPAPSDLEWLDQRRASRKPLSVELIDSAIAGRDYQIAAIRSILEGVEARRRKFLLVMATGTGKTRTAAALMDVLIRARWAKRVLFLVDRIALRDQALDAFKVHVPHAPRWPEPGETAFERSRRIYVTTYPTMLNLIEGGTTPESWISPHFFDVVIADESHRSIYNIYQQVLDYFNAIKLGLTATPKDHIDYDTFRLFDCDRQVPTFAYAFEEAVAHEPPYLCDFEVLAVRSKYQIEGIKGAALAPAVQKQLLAEGRDLEDIDFEGTDLERKVTNAGTNALLLREFVEEAIQDPSGTLPGKTIIFAISIKHAQRLERLLNDMFPEHAGRLARVLVSEDSRVHGKGGLLDQFKHADMPRVAVSVDMLDTGVDVPEVVNLVFAKPVYSYVKFWQMIGRGTRVLPDDRSKRRPWCPEKDRFLILDCWGNFEFFKLEPKGREPDQQVPLPVKLFRARLAELDAAFGAGRLDIAAAVKADLRRDLAALPKNNVLVAEHAALLAEVTADAFWDRLRPRDIERLRATVAPILRARSGADFAAMRFELDVVGLATARLAGDGGAFEALQAQVVEQVADLPLTINLVARERELIEATQGAAWWAEPSDEDLRALVDRLAPLMRLRDDRRERDITMLDIQDLLAVKEWVEFGPAHERITTAAYQAMVEGRVRALVAENPVLGKLQAGQPVSDAEVSALADLLASQDPYVTEGLLRQVYDHKTAHFVQFMRHILGLEKLADWPATVHRAFDAFIAEHTTLTSLQVQFLQTLRTFVLQTGRIERRNLIEPPFTQIHPLGVRGVFEPREIEEVLALAQGLVA